ncbi:conjugative transposon protein TraN [Chryseobacterium arthrosphaerae]|uniref:Conjugative transposon protein TraN n=1 Tax=Chryseobacterium oryzae TaxID=2929799 RepID=A0ABY4BE47_9FLAO|nr:MULTISPECIES: conjugative transposon protein TraN [Chryseobacterium]OCK51399.1 conjugative transposon protein TraN [Chryseobacterium sp. CBo1]UEQ78004.1 conjugative transposon protein TraN [Chryseobacterium arthrosphaerae]UOE37416.1 conjugative transposon protein TraN [Chryseobacterium oryzae]
MKSILYTLLLFAITVNAQTATKEQIISELPEIEITEGINLHIISPEPIQYVDLSTAQLTGDLPTTNIARIKITDEQKSDEKVKKVNHSAFLDRDKIGIITVMGQSFIAQYKAVYRNSENLNTVTNIHIQAEAMQPIEFDKMIFSNLELRKFAVDIIQKKSENNPIRQEKDFNLSFQLNNVYVISDYIFLDMTFKNNSNLSYDIEALKFSIEDKKIHKATNNQSIEMMPLFQLNPQKHFKKNFRNIYVFKKFTYPNSKVMMIRLIEEQLSGRTIEMKVNYSDILKADTF